MLTVDRDQYHCNSVTTEKIQSAATYVENENICVVETPFISGSTVYRFVQNNYKYELQRPFIDTGTILSGSIEPENYKYCRYLDTTCMESVSVLH